LGFGRGLVGEDFGEHFRAELESRSVEPFIRGSVSVKAAFAKWPLLIPARAQRARFFDDARGSALECAACLDASVADSEHVHEEPFLNGLPTGEWASIVTKTASRVNSPGDGGSIAVV